MPLSSEFPRFDFMSFQTLVGNGVVDCGGGGGQNSEECRIDTWARCSQIYPLTNDLLQCQSASNVITILLNISNLLKRSFR